MSNSIVDGELRSPEDTTCSAEERSRSVAVVPYTISNVRRLEDGEWHSSPSFYVQGLKWDMALKVGKEEQHPDPVLGFFLRYLGGAESSRPVLDIEMELRLVNQMDTVITYKKVFNESFDTSIQTKLGSSQYVFWSDVLNPQRGYLKDDTITVQISLAATRPLQKIDLSSARAAPVVGTNKKEPLSAKSKSDDERLQSQFFSLTISDRAQHMLDCGIGSDCEFVVNDGENTSTFLASRIFLAKYSEAFERMFFGNFDSETPIRVEDVKPAVFYQMLKYTYGCSWSLESRENAKDLYYLADRYLMDDLKKICLEYLWPKDVDSLWVAFDLAICNDLSELKTAAVKIICEHTGDVFKSESFLQLNQASLITILEQKNLNIASEMQVFEATTKWATAQCRAKGLPVTGPNLRLELGAGMQYIRFLAMTLKELIGIPYDCGLLTAEEAIAFVRASVDGRQYLPPSNLCPLRKPRQLNWSDQPAPLSQGSFPSVFGSTQSTTSASTFPYIGNSIFSSPRQSQFGAFGRDSSRPTFTFTSSTPSFSGGRPE